MKLKIKKKAKMKQHVEEILEKIEKLPDPDKVVLGQSLTVTYLKEQSKQVLEVVKDLDSIVLPSSESFKLPKLSYTLSKIKGHNKKEVNNELDVALRGIRAVGRDLKV